MITADRIGHEVLFAVGLALAVPISWVAYLIGRRLERRRRAPLETELETSRRLLTALQHEDWRTRRQIERGDESEALFI